MGSRFIAKKNNVSLSPKIIKNINMLLFHTCHLGQLITIGELFLKGIMVMHLSDYTSYIRITQRSLDPVYVEERKNKSHFQRFLNMSRENQNLK